MDYPNWFEATEARYNFHNYLTRFAGNPNLRFLQIGAFTGDASVWMLENILTNPSSHLVDVDTWLGSDEHAHHAMDFNDVEKTYLSKVSKFYNASQFKGTSDDFFLQNKDTFDFIYIDGDHTSFGVMKDAINSFSCLNSGGILAFDDYLWTEGRGKFYEPRPAIDAFLDITEGMFSLLESGWQVWLQKFSA